MAEFTYPPFDGPEPPAPLSPLVGLNPPMVGTASPWIHVDAQNRDLILESIRAWVRTVLLAWTTEWQDQLTVWEDDVEAWLNGFMAAADAYITEHAVAGLSFRTTATAINGAGTTNVVLVVDTNLRPIAINDLVLSSDITGNYGVVTALIDATHATVTYVGSLRGPQGIPGLSWRATATPIASGGGTTDVIVALTTNRPLSIFDLVVDESADGNWGLVTVVIDATHATVAQVGSLRGPQGPAGAGAVDSVVAGTGIDVDNTDPHNPIISATGGGSGAILYGAYTDRPAIGTVADLTTYIASDVGESYLALSGAWVVFSSGEELGYAQSEDSTLITATNAADVPIPGLKVTFIAGENPIMINYLLRLSVAASGTSMTKCTVYVEQGVTGAGVIASAEFFAGDPSGNWHAFSSAVRLYGLTPGDTYTASITIASEDTGTIYYAADHPTPTYIQAMGL